MLFNIVDIKVGWLVVELKLLDRPMRHEPAEVRCAEVASCVHGGGGEWLEIGGIAEDKLTFLSVATKNMVAVSVPFKRTSWLVSAFSFSFSV